MYLIKQKLFQRLLPLLIICFGAVFSADAQNINIKFKDTPIKSILKEITRQSGYTFVYSDLLTEVENKKTIEYSAKEQNIESLLKQIFAGTKVSWTIVGKQIALNNTVKAKAETTDGKQSFIKGVIRDDIGEPVAGVVVQNKNSRKTAISAQDGSYAIEAKEGDVIVFSLLGMSEFVFPVGKSTSVDISMKPETVQLENIVVTGYQTLSKERVTGSYSIIGSELLNKPTTSLEQSIIGNMSGVQIVNKAYRGRDEEFVIRGLTSLGANSNPLIIVDGFAIEGTISSINPNDIASITVLKDAAAASIWGARSANGVIVVTTKSPQKGRTGKVSVELNAFVKVGEKMDLDYAYPVATSAETIEYEKLGFDSNFFKLGSLIANNYSSAAYYSYARNYSQAVIAMNEKRLGFLSQDAMNAELQRLASLDNKDQIRDYLLSTPMTQQYNLTISGGMEKISNILTVMYDKNLAEFKGNERQRYTFNYRTKVDLFKWLELNVGSMYQNSVNVNNGSSLAEIQNISPYDMLLDAGGNYTSIQKDLYMPIIDRYIIQKGVKFPYNDFSFNPLREMKGRDITTRSSYGRVQAGLKFKIIEGLTFDSKFQYEIMNDNKKSLYSADTYQVRFNVNYNSKWDGNPATAVKQNYANGMAISEGYNSLDAWNLRNQLNFDRTFNNIHTISFIAGTEVSERVYQTTTYPLMYGYNSELLSITAPINGITSPSNPLYNMFGSSAKISYPTPSRTYSVDKYFSVYGNLSYTYKDKYTLTGSVRTDASNLISSDPSIRYSPFWSVGGLWQMYKEPFMDKVGFVDRLILRATYGFNGNVDKSTSVSPLISVSGQNTNYGTGYGSISNYGNPYLSWEKTGTFDFGVDFSILNNKLTGKVDYYNKQGRDLISSVAIANVYGSDKQSINAVSMYNKGIELTIGSNLQKGAFSWNGNLNFSYNKNKITKLFKDRSTLANRILGPGSGWEYAEGFDANTLWAFNYGGMQNIGGLTQPVIVDKNGENPRPMTTYHTTFDSYNYLIPSGSYVAPFIAGLNNSFRYGDFNLSFIITGYFGHKFKRLGFNYPTMTRGVGNINKYYSEIKNCDPSEFIPLPTEGRYPSQIALYATNLTNIIINAANIRFQEINLTYNLPKRILAKIRFNEMSIFGQLNDIGVILFNKYGQDPFYPMESYKPGLSFTFGTKINL
jgi:TonB-linked SusC/RagA family outer membrane protein